MFVARMARAAVIAGALLEALPSVAQPTEAPAAASTALVLTLNQARTKALDASPLATLSDARVREVEGRREGASLVVRDNPVLSLDLGPRITSDARSTSATPRGGVGIELFFDVGGGRQARLDGVDASIARTQAENQDAQRRLLRNVSVAFVRCLWAAERIELAEQLAQSGGVILKLAEEKLAAGDVSQLEKNAAQAELSKLRAQKKSLEAESIAAKGELKALLGIDPSTDIDVQGDLRERRSFDLEKLIAMGDSRADLRALDAETREAAADIDLSGSLAWPKLGLGAQFEHEEPGIDSVLGTVSITLPFFDRAQGMRAEAIGKSYRARAQRALLEKSVTAEVMTAFDVYRKRSEAVAALEEGGVTLFEDNVVLGEKGFRAGEVGLLNLLTLRRELVDAEIEYLDELRERATAGFDLELAAGGAVR